MLRRPNIDLDACEIRVTEALVQPGKGGPLFDTLKSEAGKRTVTFPREIVDEIRWHLEKFAEPGQQRLVFVGPKGGKLRRSNFHKSVWSPARTAVDLPDLHIHDLRHTGAILSEGRGVALDATFRAGSEDGAGKDGGEGTPGRRSLRHSEPAGQDHCGRTVLR